MQLINTISGALSELNKMIPIEHDRYAHVIGVTNKVERILRSIMRDTSKEFESMCVQATLLHDIGYSPSINIENYHPIDGYVYLRDRGWASEVCRAVLEHSFAKDQLHYLQPDLTHYYKLKPCSKYEQSIIEILSYADLHTSNVGGEVSIKERYENIRYRYGETSPIYLTMESILPAVGLLIEKIEAL
jgi:hypothetical protein